MKINILKNRILISIYLCLFSSITFAQRNVGWVGGLNETNNFWEQYSALFQTERQLNTFNNDYSGSMKAGVPRLADVINNSLFAFNNTNALCIGHSMGGVALRENDRRNSGLFGGYITVGGPMSGAYVAASVLNGSVQSAITDALDKVLDGPTTALIGIPVVDDIAADALAKYIGRVVSPDVSYYGRPTLQDLDPNGNYMQGIQNFAGNVPAVSIQGVENGPVQWRMASSTKQGEGNVTEDDEKFVKIANTMYDIYNGFYIANLATFNFYAATRWKKGRDYLRDQSEGDYLNIIGARHYETVTYTYQAYMCGSYNSYDTEYWNCLYYNAGSGEDCSQYCYQTFTSTYVNVVEEPSDGFIPAGSQIGQGTAWQRQTGDIYKAEGANHLQEGSHSATREQFNRIFNRGDVFGIRTR